MLQCIRYGRNVAGYGIRAMIRIGLKSFRRALGRAHLPPTTVFRCLKTTRRCFDGRPIPVSGIFLCYFPNIIKFRVAVHTLREKASRLWHPGYDPDRAQKLISSPMSRHLSTRKMSSKSMHAFLSNLDNRQTSIVGNRIYLLRCRR